LTIEAAFGSGPNYCTKCAYGFYIGSTGFCVACPTNFATCSVSAGLLSFNCRTGYVVQWSSGVPSCAACTGNCASCTVAALAVPAPSTAIASTIFINNAVAGTTLSYAEWTPIT